MWAAATQAGEISWGYLPEPIIPPDNPLTPAKVALGRRLFAEAALSVNGAYSCASCHQPQRHFTDGRSTAIGATAELHSRNTPTLYNVAFNASLGWEDLGITTLEAQHRVPLFNTDPVEMGYHPGLLEQLAGDASYREDFAAAFGDEALDTDRVVKALASYVRTIVAPASAFDAYLFEDDKTGMSGAALTGMQLFFSPRLGCADCHASLSLSGPIRHTLQDAPPVFHVTGVGGATEAFRAPTLRMIRHTAPYMHDGSLASLDEVIRHYESTNAQRVPDFELSQAERAALVAFLRSL